MSFHLFADGQTASAVDVMENFYHIFQGNRLPYGGTILSATNATYDIGSSSYKWSQLHCVNLNVNSITTSTKYLWKLITCVQVTAAATSIDITGLNGDNERDYMLEFHLTDNGKTAVDMIFNGDSAASYGVEGGGITVGAFVQGYRNTGTSIALLHESRNNTTTAKYGSAWCQISGYSGYPKGVIKFETNSVINTIYRIYNEAWAWTGIGTIASIKFIASTISGIGVGTVVNLWGRA